MNTKALWYLTRGFGLVDLVLLTVIVGLGVAQVARYARPGLPRFVIAGIHRNAALLSVVLLVVHVLTAVADPYAPIRLVDAFIPFVGKYRPFWLGLGALACDILLALVVTSLMRLRMGHQTWRAVHWAAYACWPIAVVHGLGTGSDSRSGWTQALYALCTLAVLLAVGWRLTSRWTVASPGRRLGAASAAALIVLLGLVWTAEGPLRPGWAHRAGTPTPALVVAHR